MIQLMYSDVLTHSYMTWMPKYPRAQNRVLSEIEFKTLNRLVFKNCQINGKNVQEILKQNYGVKFPDIVKPHSR